MIFGINALATPSGTTGGSQTYLRELVAHLALVDQENEYRLFVNAENESTFPVDAPNCRVTVAPRLAGGRYEQWGAEQLWLPLAAQRAGARVLLCPSPTIPRLWSRPSVVMVENLLGFHPELWDGAGGRLRRLQSRAHYRAYRRVLRRAARRAAAVLAVSEQTRRETVRYCAVDPTRIVVARHGVSSEFQPVQDTERLRLTLDRYGLRRPYLLAVGGISPYKNLNRVLEALAQVRRWSHRLPMLALVGEDRFACRPGLERLAAALDLEEQVRFLGVLPQSVLPALYTAATASLSLSSCEASGLPIVEAMACGCPVVCARRSSLPEVAGDAALFVDPDRPHEVAEAIWRLSTLPNVRDAWVETGLQRARQFDWRETSRITRDVLVAVARGQPVRPMPGAVLQPRAGAGEDPGTRSEGEADSRR